jgi:hypothetical protein
MLHRKAEIEKQHFRKESSGKQIEDSTYESLLLTRVRDE